MGRGEYSGQKNFKFANKLCFSGINFYTQSKVCCIPLRSLSFVLLTMMQTVTSLWKAEDAIATRASVNMPTHD